MVWSILMSDRPISSTEMSRYKYSGRNAFGERIPNVLQCDSLVADVEETIFPCRVYDGNGKLKYIISKQEIINKAYKKLLKK